MRLESLGFHAVSLLPKRTQPPGTVSFLSLGSQD